MKKLFALFLLCSALEARIDPVTQLKIMAKHGPEARGSASFNSHITPKRLEKLAKEAIAHGKEVKGLSTSTSKVYEFRFHIPLGVNRNGEKSTTLRVVATPQGEILDAYPN